MIYVQLYNYSLVFINPAVGFIFLLFPILHGMTFSDWYFKGGFFKNQREYRRVVGDSGVGSFVVDRVECRPYTG